MELNETPTMAQVIQNAIDAKICGMHVCLPGEIVSYDSEKQVAKVQPLIRKSYKNGNIVNLPTLTDVPVMMPRTGNAIISLPMAKGDSVVLFFSERSLDEWKVNGGLNTPESTRKFDLSDGFCYPGGYPLGGPTSVNADNLQMKFNDAVIEITPTGKVGIGNGTEELIASLVELLDTLLTAQVFTSIGNQPFVAPTILELNAIKTKLEALKI